MEAKGTLPKTMKALVAYSATDYRLETDYPVPAWRPRRSVDPDRGLRHLCRRPEVSAWSGHVLGDDTQPAWVKPPFIPGHEFIGKVVWAGENVSGYALGERIAVDQIAPCGACRFCKDGPLLDVPAARDLRLFPRFLRRHGRVRAHSHRSLRHPPGPQDMPLEAALPHRAPMPAPSTVWTGRTSAARMWWCSRAPAPWDSAW